MYKKLEHPTDNLKDTRLFAGKLKIDKLKIKYCSMLAARGAARGSRLAARGSTLYHLQVPRDPTNYTCFRTALFGDYVLFSLIHCSPICLNPPIEVNPTSLSRCDWSNLFYYFVLF